MQEKTKRKIAIRKKRKDFTDIPLSVKQTVWLRDRGRCVICGNNYNTMPNAHYIPRSKGGLGIEQNIVTLCTGFTENKCHHRMDHTIERKALLKVVKEYLESQYPDWDEEKLYYRRRND